MITTTNVRAILLFLCSSVHALFVHGAEGERQFRVTVEGKEIALPLPKLKIKPSAVLRDLTCLVVDQTRKHDYQQQLPNARAIRGHKFWKTDKNSFGDQAACQHTCGYYRGLDLVPGPPMKGPLILPITSTCGLGPSESLPDKNDLVPRCKPCSDWGEAPPQPS